MDQQPIRMTDYKLYDRPITYYEAMLKDIEQARRYIYLETYKFGADGIGNRFKESLTRKAQQGVKVKLLIDSWGATFDETHFAELIRYGGEVRMFRKIKLSFDFFTKNHRRNHRKLLLIDDHISYIGSANITEYSLNWRESMLRLTGGITDPLKKTFRESYKNYSKYQYNKFTYKKTIFYNEFEIVQDVPSIYRQQIKTKLEKLLQKARQEVVIETPYFLPGHKLRKCLTDAAKRGVKVTLILPRRSDVRSIDLLSSKYLGYYYNSNIRLVFFSPSNLHAKTLLIDNQIFGIGSPNIDYRSFRYQHEIMLFGKHHGIIEQIKQHQEETLRHCTDFDFQSWKRRPNFEKVLGWLLLPFRHIF
jgi:cardiolipin synthase A/B